MFSGSTQGVTDDSCGHRYTGPNLAAQFIAAGHSFAGYSEGLPATGSAVCSAGSYARKHNPWSDFANVPAADNKPFTAFPTSSAGFDALPTLSYVVPNLDDDMHDGTVTQADQWLSAHLGSYARWAPAHNSLLIVTWDENDYSAGNQIATILVGAHLQAGTDGRPATHYSVLRALEDSASVAHLGGAAAAPALTGFWR
jgi:acid phosphatase